MSGLENLDEGGDQSDPPKDPNAKGALESMQKDATPPARGAKEAKDTTSGAGPASSDEPADLRAHPEHAERDAHLEARKANAADVAKLMHDQPFRQAVIDTVLSQVNWGPANRLATTGRFKYTTNPSIEAQRLLGADLNNTFKKILGEQLKTKELHLPESIERTAIVVDHKRGSTQDRPSFTQTGESRSLFSGFSVIARNGDNYVIVPINRSGKDPTSVSVTNVGLPTILIHPSLSGDHVQVLYKIWNDATRLAQIDSRDGRLPYDELKAQADRERAARDQIYHDDLKLRTADRAAAVRDEPPARSLELPPFRINTVERFFDIAIAEALDHPRSTWEKKPEFPAADKTKISIDKATGDYVVAGAHPVIIGNVDLILAAAVERAKSEYTADQTVGRIGRFGRISQTWKRSRAPRSNWEWENR